MAFGFLHTFIIALIISIIKMAGAWMIMVFKKGQKIACSGGNPAREEKGRERLVVEDSINV